MKPRLPARTLTAATAAGLMLLGFTGSANAHVVYERPWRYQGPEICTKTYAEISNGYDNRGYSVGGIEVWGYNAGWCKMHYEQPAGYIAVQFEVLAYDVPSNVWFRCNNLITGWNYNSSPGWDPSWYLRPNLACGDRWYATNAGAFAWNGTEWRGGWAASGNHWLAAPTLTASKPDPAPEISAKEAVRQGLVRNGSPTGPRLTPAALTTAKPSHDPRTGPAPAGTDPNVVYVP
ncbi:hypothetical protein ACFCZ1_04600 [Streptomyces sp. NPDC056224]|uniref:hypothetical protein n=1 Tax=Streptomyces sp. NPDC056224 TaxID=3345750 RepID=UPI0035E072FF